MFTKFLNLKPEKQERILNAAIREFAQKGFKNASTDEIVKEANISKGALFYYFNSKKDLFLFLYDHFIEIFIKEFFGKIDLNEKNILKRWRQIALVKIELINKYPEVFDFMLVANMEDSEEIKRDLECRNKEVLTSSYEKLFKDIDTSKFKEDIDIKRAIDIIIWTMEGFSDREQEKIKSLSLDQIYYDNVLQEMNVYIKLLKTSFYKENTLSFDPFCLVKN